MNNNGDDKKLDWMYKGANSLVDREEYLLGRSVDKSLEQLNAEEKEKKLGLVPPKNHVEHECIPPSIRDFNKVVQAEQVDISAKLQEDPLVAIKKREDEARRQFLQNPVQLKKLQEALKAQQLKKKKKKRKKSKTSDSDSDLDSKIARKLKYLKEDPSTLNVTKKQKDKSKESVLDTILMHKFNQLKDKLSQDDLNDILAGNVSDSDDEKKKKKRKKKKGEEAKSESEGSESDRKRSKNREKGGRSGSTDNVKKARRRREESDSSEDEEERKYRNKKAVDRKGYKEDKREVLKGRKDGDKKSRSIEQKRHRKDKKERPKDRDKHKKVRKRSSSEESSASSEESSSEDDLKKKKDKKDGRKKSASKNGRKKARNSSSSDDDEDKDKHEHGHSKKSTDNSDSDLESKILKRLRMIRDSALSEPQEDERRTKQSERAKDKRGNASGSEESGSEDTRGLIDDSDDQSSKPRAFGLVKSDGTKLALGRRGEVKSAPKMAAKADAAARPEKRNVKRLTEEEKERLRLEMMSNAEQRDKERSKNLRRYREEDKREEREAANFDEDFVRKELLKTTKDATVETRIKSNLNNIQRSSRHMDSHFSRRK